MSTSLFVFSFMSGFLNILLNARTSRQCAARALGSGLRANGQRSDRSAAPLATGHGFLSPKLVDSFEQQRYTHI
jgi:hypothetical protein